GSCRDPLYLPPPAAPPISPLSLHDALPICGITEVVRVVGPHLGGVGPFQGTLHPDRVHRTHLTERECAQEGDGDDVSTGHTLVRSEEHTSELQSRFELVCRLLPGT